MGDEFDFDFFADEDTAEAAEAPRRAPAQNLPRALTFARRRRRLAAAVAAFIAALILIVVLLTQGSGSDAAAYRDYVRRLSPIASDSQQTGRALQALFSGMRAGKTNDPLPELDRLAGNAGAELARAARLRPAAELRPVQQQALLALAFRVNGVQGLHDAIGQALGSTGSAGEPAIASQIARLTTSDVVWKYLVRRPLEASLRQLKITDVVAPRSQFLFDPNASSPASISTLLHPTTAAGQTIELGSTGAAVASWQREINHWLLLSHHTPLTADGTFGTATVAATEALQRARGLAPDGIVGPRTRVALAAALAGRVASR